MLTLFNPFSPTRFFNKVEKSFCLCYFLTFQVLDIFFSLSQDSCFCTKVRVRREPIFSCGSFHQRLDGAIFDKIKELENKRKMKERAQVAYERRKQLAKLRVKAEKAAEEKLGPQLAVIEPIKY